MAIIVDDILKLISFIKIVVFRLDFPGNFLSQMYN